MSYALRHAPAEHGLTLDSNGWTRTDDLRAGIALRSPEWLSVTEQDVEHVVLHSAKTRFEIAGDSIRALYGHSTEDQIIHTPAQPPELLYHGTSKAAWELIKTQGLRPMKRQYVHLSTDAETALLVGRRKTIDPILIQVNAAEAAAGGTGFFVGNDSTWLALEIPPQFLKSDR